MILCGSSSKTRDLGFAERKRCETCGKERPFKLFLRYRYGHIAYLFKWVKKKKYYVLCRVCHRGRRVAAKQAEANLKTNPIPFGTRYGWTFFVGLIVAVGVAGAAIRSELKKADDYAYISAPRSMISMSPI